MSVATACSAIQNNPDVALRSANLSRLSSEHPESPVTLVLQSTMTRANFLDQPDTVGEKESVADAVLPRSTQLLKQYPMRAPTADASAIYRYRDSLAAVDALAAAVIHLDLFTELAREPGDLAAVCQRLSIQPRPADALCTLLIANGLLRRDKDGVLELTNASHEFLVTGSPFNARAYYASMADKPGVADFLKVLQTGRPANWPGQEGEGDWHAAMQTNEFAEAFTAAMDCRGRILGPALSTAIEGSLLGQLLDIGGGSGVYSIAIAEAYPSLQATILEAPLVDVIAGRTIHAAGLDHRIDVMTADLFEDTWPTGYDTHLFSNVLHDWDEPECRRLLEQSVASLTADGRIIIHDMLLNDDKSGPLWAAEYSVLLTTVTRGRLYSAAEIGHWLAELGFRITHQAPTALGRSVLTATKW